MILLAAFAAASTLVEWSLETNDGAFMESGETLQWEWGTVSNGPMAGFDGQKAWAVGLTQDYLNDTTDYLEIPLPDLSRATYPGVSFVHWYSIADGDHAWIEVDAGEGWAMVAPTYGYPSGEGWTGMSSGWTRVGVDLRGLGPSPKLRLAFAADTSGVADGWFVDDVGVYDGDILPPRLADLSVLADTEDLDGPYPVTVSASDDVGLAAVTLLWSANGGSEQEVPMDEVDGGWAGAIPGQPPGTDVTYRVAASDGLNESVEPPLGSLGFRVFLPAPVDLTGPGGRVIGATAELAWSAPTSIHTVTRYRVYRDTDVVAESTGTTAEVPLTGEDDTFVVRAVFDVGEGDPSNAFTVDAAVPRLLSLDPAEGFPGDTLRVLLRGEYLFLVDGQVAVSFGDGVRVGGLQVKDVDLARVDLYVDPDAVPGPRDVTVSTPLGDTVAPGLFEVVPTDAAPRLLSVSPGRVDQGVHAALTVDIVGTFAAAPTADFGDGIVVEAAELTDADTVVFDVAIAPNAPLGAHPLRLDDGVRVLTGVDLVVEDVIVDPGGTCGGAGGISGLGALAGLAAASRRRRPR